MSNVAARVVRWALTMGLLWWVSTGSRVALVISLFLLFSTFEILEWMMSQYGGKRT